jgi:hypothetical protein
MTINHIGVIDSNVFVGGEFNSKDFGVTNFACWDGQQWKNIGGANTFSLDSMLTLGGKLYVTGNFSDAGSACKFWDGTNWVRVPWPATGGQQRLATDGVDIYIAHEAPSVRVARWTGTQVIEIPVDVPLASLSALAVSGTNIFVAGAKTNDMFVSHNLLYRWNGSNWSQLPIGLGPDEEIRAMTGFGDRFIVAGRFRNIAGILANSIAEWDDSAWHSLDRGLTSLDAPGTVMDLALLGNRLLVTGGFDQASRTSSGNIAIWNRASEIQFRVTENAFGAFEVTGGSGDRVAIENSDDLVTWTEVSELGLSSSGTQIAQPDPNSTQKFYRARILPPKN